MVYSRSEKKERDSKKTEYMRNYRQRVSEEKRKEWAKQGSLRKKQSREKAAEARQVRAKQIRSEQNRRAYVKRVCPMSPSTPTSKAKRLSLMIEQASPSTSEALSTQKIYKVRERDAHAAVVSVTSECVKGDRKVRRSLLPKLAKFNKKAVAETLSISRNHFYYKSQRGRNPRVAKTTVDKVIQFYRREDISTHFPNKNKNLIVLKQSKKKTFHLFKEEYPSDIISPTSFYKLRPKNVKLMKAGKYLQCVCDICDSIQMIARGIRLSMSRNGFLVPNYLEAGNELELAKGVVCDLKVEACVYRKCDSCSPQTNLRPDFKDWIKDDTHAPVTYQTWGYVTEIFKDKPIKKMRKIPKQVARWEAFQELCEKLQQYPLHIRDAICQLSSYRKCKETLGVTEAVCIVDYAENYVCRQFSEAQSAYYSRSSVTLHPMVLVFSQSYHIQRDSVVCLSSDLRHDGASVAKFFEVLNTHMMVHHPSIKQIKVWSDGCSAQYKSRVPMFNISKGFSSPSYVITWNFYGSRHGKSESDGESGIVKTYLDNAVKAQQLTINGADDVYRILNSSDLNIDDGLSRRHFYNVSASDIESLRARYVALRPQAIPGIRKIHQVKPNDSLSGVMYRSLSCYCVDECWHNQEWHQFVYTGQLWKFLLSNMFILFVEQLNESSW